MAEKGEKSLRSARDISHRGRMLIGDERVHRIFHHLYFAKTLQFLLSIQIHKPMKHYNATVCCLNELA